MSDFIRQRLEAVRDRRGPRLAVPRNPAPCLAGVADHAIGECRNEATKAIGDHLRAIEPGEKIEQRATRPASFGRPMNDQG